MGYDWRMQTATLDLDLDSQRLLEQEPHLAHGGLFVPVPDPPPEPFSTLHVRIGSPHGADVELAATVVQLVPGSGMALAFSDPGEARRKLLPLLAAARHTGAPEEGERPEGTVHDQIRAMSARERMQLALSGGRTERRILIKDPNKAIHVFVLKNPRVTLDEVRYLAGYAQANPEALKMIADSREWLQSAGVVTALVRNPKTPPMTAVRLLDRLPTAELRRLAKATNVPMAISQAAKKKVIGLT